MHSEFGLQTSIPWKEKHLSDSHLSYSHSPQTASNDKSGQRLSGKSVHFSYYPGTIQIDGEHYFPS